MNLRSSCMRSVQSERVREEALPPSTTYFSVVIAEVKAITRSIDMMVIPVFVLDVVIV